MENYVINLEDCPFLLSVKQVSEITGYNEAIIRSYCKRGLMPHIRLARAYKIPRDKLKDWIFELADKNCKLK